MRIMTILKEGIIFVLLTIVVIFLLMILLSDFVPTEESAQSVQYVAESNVKATLEEVDAVVGEDEDIDSLLKSYTVDESDLKIYETAKSYESGKSNPFSDFPATEYENTVTTPTIGGGTSSSSGKGGSSQGTFFEGSTK